jgi:D-glycero-alpha-D-manno-heptose-7-phosphate kinase
MIISKTPLRICLGGGGTDIKEYYSDHGGFVISAAINKFVYVIINQHEDGDFHLIKSNREIVHSLQEVYHPIAKEVINYLDIKGDFEILTVSDIPASSGLGTSSSFTVGIIKALFAYKKVTVTNYEIAEIACKIERDILREPGGKQDQYIAAFGGITWFEFKKDDSVTVSPLRINHNSIEMLEKGLLIFNIGDTRSSSAIQGGVISKLKKGISSSEHLHMVKELGFKAKEIFENNNIDEYGQIMHQHWNYKKELSGAITNPKIDSLYEIGMSAGSLGGKVIGAGGGGYIMFYNQLRQEELIEKMNEQGLPELHFRFEFDGSKIIIHE